MLALLLGVMPGLAPSVVAAEPEARTYEHRMAQGRFLLESGRWRQALAEFDAAAQEPQGAGDPEPHALKARAAWELGLTGEAIEAIRRAAALGQGSLDEDARRLHDYLAGQFGKVLVVGAGARDSRSPVPAAPLLDPQLRRVFEAAVAELAEGGEGSTSVWLPVGTYRVGDHLVEVRAGSSARFDLRPGVGLAAEGVYGEVALRRGPGLRPSLWLRAGAHRLVQQGSGMGQGGLRAGLQADGDVLALRIAGGVELGRAERLVAGDARAAVLPGVGLALGVAGPAGDARIGPWLGWWGAYARPLGAAEGYPGPEHYLVHGPELEVRVAGPVSFGQVAVAVGARLLEAWPLGARRVADRTPHLAVGAGAAVELQIGGAR